MASQRGSPKVADVVAAAAVEATAGARDAQVALMGVVRCCTQSFAEFGVETWLWGCRPATGKMASELGGCGDSGYEMEV